MKRKAIIIDIDGTLSDARGRVKTLQNELRVIPSAKDISYEHFYREAKNDPQIDKNIIKITDYMYNNFPSDSFAVPPIIMPAVIFLTGRPERIKEDTIDWVKNKCELPNDDRDIFIFRKDKDYSKDVDYKKRELEKIKNEYEVMAVFEDRKHLVEMFKKELPESEVFKV